MNKNIEDVRGEKVMRRDHFIFAIVLVVFATLAFLFSCQKILKIVEDSCFDRLREYAKVVSHEFIVNNLHYGGTLQFIATSLEDRPEYSVDSVQSWLKDMRPFLKEQKISMLLPGDTVILPNGAIAQASALGLSYDKEKSSDSHVAVRLEGENQNEKFLYHFVPVKSQGQTVAMLFWNYSLGLIHQYLRADKGYDRKMFVAFELFWIYFSCSICIK